MAEKKQTKKAKTTAKKATGSKKPAAKKTVAKKTTTKKAAVKKPATKKTTTAKKAVTKKSTPVKKTTTASKGVIVVETAKNEITWILNPKVYPLEIVYQAAYTFIDRAYLRLDYDAKKNLVVVLKGKENLKAAALEALQGEFGNELINQALRSQIAKNNSRLRELIVAKALFAAGRPDALKEVMDSVAPSAGEAPRPWDQATKEEQDELDRLLAEIEKDFSDDPMGIAVPWDEKYGSEKSDEGKSDNTKKEEPKE